LTKPFADSPGKPIACSMPGVAKAICDIWRTTRSVRSSEAALGRCTTPIRYCLSWLGMKPPGTIRNMNHVQTSRMTKATRMGLRRRPTTATAEAYRFDSRLAVNQTIAFYDMNFFTEWRAVPIQ